MDRGYTDYHLFTRWTREGVYFVTRWNLFSYRNLWEWLNRPFDTPPEPSTQIEFKLDSISTTP